MGKLSQMAESPVLTMVPEMSISKEGTVGEEQHELQPTRNDARCC
jgi:hypothetical protein